MKPYEACEICRGPLPYGGHVATPICDACLDGGAASCPHCQDDTTMVCAFCEPESFDNPEEEQRIQERVRRGEICLAHLLDECPVCSREATC